MFSWAAVVPFAKLLALITYLTLLSAIFLPAWRQWLVARLSMPRPSTQPHIASLDALRGFAACWVASFHAWQWWGSPLPDLAHPTVVAFLSQGAKAVPLFVALSGFLIARVLQSVATISDLRRYARNRVLRIAPLYLASACAIILVGQISGPKAISALSELFALRTFGSLHFANPPLWSLYVEIAFYAVAPICVIFAGRRLALAVLIAGVVLGICDVEGPREFQLWKYFCAGVIASECEMFLRERGTPEWLALGLFALGASWTIADVLFAGPLALIAANPIGALYSADLVGANICLMAGAALSRRVSQVAAFGPLRIIGTVSFSLFVWHSFVIVADAPLRFDGPMLVPAQFVDRPSIAAILFVILPGALGVACLSFMLIERSFLKLREGRGVTEPRHKMAEIAAE